MSLQIPPPLPTPPLHAPPLGTRPTTGAALSQAAPPNAALTTGGADATVLDIGELLPNTLYVLPWIGNTGNSDTGGSTAADTNSTIDHDPRSAYVETFWLPVIGPSMTLLLRRLADEFDAAPGGFEINTIGLSRDIGLGPRIDRRGTFAKTLERCAKFSLMQISDDMLYVRRRIRRLTPRQVSRLGDRLTALHHSWSLDATDDGSQRRTELVRATHLARTLLSLGESQHDTERQLHQWHFHPSIAWHAVQWAQAGPEQLP